MILLTGSWWESTLKIRDARQRVKCTARQRVSKRTEGWSRGRWCPSTHTLTALFGCWWSLSGKLQTEPCLPPHTISGTLVLVLVTCSSVLRHCIQPNPQVPFSYMLASLLFVHTCKLQMLWTSTLVLIVNGFNSLNELSSTLQYGCTNMQ